MPLGLLTGLAAALSWGTLDLLSALASRRVGSLVVTTGMQLVGASLVWVIALAVGTVFPTDPFVLVGGALVGLAGAGAYLSYFTGLRLGPIAVVSGIIGAYGGLTVVLAVVVRGESLSLTQAIGAVIATCGVVLVGISFDGGGLRGAKLAGPGVAFAFVAFILFALMTIGSDIVIDHTDWLSALLVSRSANVILSVVVLIVASTALRGRSGPLLEGESGTASRMDRRVFVAIVLAGILDVLGLLAFAYGLQYAETWLVGLASSFGPAVTIVVAVLVLGERLKSIQWLGLAGVLTGVVLIALPG
jgi:drug/metabolite transporter (DMT)-like permease